MPELAFAAWRAICSLKADYFRFVDEKRWEELTALFTDDATFFYPVFGVEMNRAEAIDALRTATTGVQSIHNGSLPVIVSESADLASGTWNMEDRLYTASATPGRFDLSHGFGRYHERYERHGDRWLISSLRLERRRKDVHRSVESIVTEAS